MPGEEGFFISAIANARETARALRTPISTEMWVH
jgi:uncharacterized alpha-E superfamily protein